MEAPTGGRWQAVLGAALAFVFFGSIGWIALGWPLPFRLWFALALLAGGSLTFFLRFVRPKHPAEPWKQPVEAGVTCTALLAALVAVPAIQGVSEPPAPTPSPGGSVPAATSSSTSPPPPAAFSALVDYSGDNFDPCQRVVVDDDSKTVSPVPPSAHDGSNDGDDIQAWRGKVGGVDGGSTRIRVTIQGTTEEAVVLRAMHVRVLSRDPARGSAVYLAGEGCGGGITQRPFSVNLDDPKAKPTLEDEGNEDGQKPPASFPFRVSNSDVEVFLISAHAVDCDCTWELALDWSRGLEKGQTIVNGNGQPFRTKGVPPRLPVYFPGEAGWIRSGRSADNRTFLATEGWNASYPSYKPREALLSGNSTFAIEDMKWTTWNSYSAIGIGAGAINDCRPDCARGKMRRYPVEISLSEPEEVCGNSFYTKLSVRWTSDVPAGLDRSYEWMAGEPNC